MLYFENLLVSVLIFPIFGILLLLFVSNRHEKLLKLIALNSACLTCIFSLLIWFFFQKSIGAYQFVVKFLWLPNLNLNLTLGVDGISLFFLLLTTLLIPLCLLTSWNSVKSNLKEFLIAFLFLDFLLIGTFCVLDLLFFYIFFESVLIPMGRILGSFRTLPS
jgi:NADH:ubiquinone oxidoreductase subunit 4 (subunit M)